MANAGGKAKKVVVFIVSRRINPQYYKRKLNQLTVSFIILYPQILVVVLEKMYQTTCTNIDSNGFHCLNVDKYVRGLLLFCEDSSKHLFL